MNTARINEAAVKALQVAGDWLAEACRAMVGIQTGMDGPGSPPGEPPFRRTGRGQDSIKSVHVSDGCLVGTGELTDKNGNRTFNYMQAWDQPEGINGVSRPWLRVWTERYEPELRALIKRFFEIQLRQAG